MPIPDYTSRFCVSLLYLCSVSHAHDRNSLTIQVRYSIHAIKESCWATKNRMSKGVLQGFEGRVQEMEMHGSMCIEDCRCMVRFSDLSLRISIRNTFCSSMAVPESCNATCAYKIQVVLNSLFNF